MLRVVRHETLDMAAQAISVERITPRPKLYYFCNWETPRPCVRRTYLWSLWLFLSSYEYAT